ncbi:MAG: lipoate--protein ligase [Chitinophagales bacterium]|nr:lipoate--protein ligase [Chitinophagales bacterium]
MILLANRNTGNPYINLAIEEFVVRYFDSIPEDFLLIYINEPSVVVGKNQSIYKEVNFGALKSGAVKLCRRISGGGTVYHDAGNISFAFFTPFDERKVNNYRYFNQPIVDALRKLGVEAEMDSRNNILCSGKKISGNAQFTNRKVILSHGTLLFNADLSLLRSALKLNDFEVESKAVGSVRSEVMNLQSVLPDFSSAQDLSNFIIEELRPTSVFEFSDEQWKQIEKSAGEKFQSDEWVYGRSPFTTIRKKDLVITVDEGIIKEVTSNKLDLSFLRGTPYNFKGLTQALLKHEVEEREQMLLHLL